MSRLIKKSIAIPDGVTIIVAEDVATIKGPKGELKLTAPFGIYIVIEAKEAWIKPCNCCYDVRLMWRDASVFVGGHKILSALLGDR